MTKRGKSDKLDADETHIYFITNKQIDILKMKIKSK